MPGNMFIGAVKNRAADFVPVAPASAVSVMGRSYRTNSPDQSYNLTRDRSFELYRFEIRAGERWSGDAISERSELGALDTWPMEQDIWLSYSVMVEPGPPVSSNFLVIGQFHNTPDAGEYSPSPPFEVNISSATQALEIRTRGSAENPLTSNPVATIHYIDPDFSRGKWYDFVVRFRSSYAGNGQLQVWRDGLQIINASGLVNGYNDAVGPYLKFGAYRGPTANGETFAVQYANVEVGLSSLLSRVSRPLYRPT